MLIRSRMLDRHYSHNSIIDTVFLVYGTREHTYFNIHLNESSYCDMIPLGGKFFIPDTKFLIQDHVIPYGHRDQIIVSFYYTNMFDVWIPFYFKLNPSTVLLPNCPRGHSIIKNHLYILNKLDEMTQRDSLFKILPIGNYPTDDYYGIGFNSVIPVFYSRCNLINAVDPDAISHNEFTDRDALGLSILSPHELFNRYISNHIVDMYEPIKDSNYELFKNDTLPNNLSLNNNTCVLKNDKSLIPILDYFDYIKDTSFIISFTSSNRTLKNVNYTSSNSIMSEYVSPTHVGDGHIYRNILSHIADFITVVCNQKNSSFHITIMKFESEELLIRIIGDSIDVLYYYDLPLILLTGLTLTNNFVF